MTGDTPSRKRRFPRWKPTEGQQGGLPAPAASDQYRPGTAPAVPAPGSPDVPSGALPREPDAVLPAAAGSGPRFPRLASMRQGVRRGGEGARAAVGFVADRIIENAPRVPVRDLATLRAQFPGLTPEQLADKLIAGASTATATVGAGVGAAAMLPVPPAMPAELAAEITGVAAIELKLIAELHEVYGLRPEGTLKERTTAYLAAWSEERGIDPANPMTYKNVALSGGLKRELRQQIMKRMIRNLPNLMPFMIGAAVGAVMNRRDTRQLAERVRKDLRERQVPWNALPGLPPLEQPEYPLEGLQPPRELER